LVESKDLELFLRLGGLREVRLRSK
jgi:hypothetical protein